MIVISAVMDVAKGIKSFSRVLSNTTMHKCKKLRGSEVMDIKCNECKCCDKRCEEISKIILSFYSTKKQQIAFVR